MTGQIVDTYPDAQVWTTNDPDKYSITTRNSAGPNTAGKGNVGGQTHQFLNSAGVSMGTIDDRGLLFNIAVVGMTGEIKIFPFQFSPVPPGLLYCDGSAVSRATYAALFARISTVFGVGDGSTTFNLPNYRDITLGAIGPTTFTAPQTVVGSNAVVNLQHLHAGDVHTHDISNHTHGLSNHTHTLNGHVHGMKNHTHHNSHNHNINSDGGTTDGPNTHHANISTGGAGTVTLPGDDHGHTWPHDHGGLTGGSNTADTDVPSDNITNSNTDPSSVPSNNTSDVPSPNITSNPTAANTGNALSATQSILQATMGFYVYILT